jgi:hypothetical protein
VLSIKNNYKYSKLWNRIWGDWIEVQRMSKAKLFTVSIDKLIVISYYYLNLYKYIYLYYIKQKLID